MLAGMQLRRLSSSAVVQTLLTSSCAGMVPAPGRFSCVCIRCPNAEELKASQGQGLVAAMAEVPAPFFQEGFDIDQAALWEEVVQVGWGCSRQGVPEAVEALRQVVD